jgi:uroporphyrinogen decarboxylase
MNNRSRFLATMHYQNRDRSPIYDFGFWSETRIFWQEQGLPNHIRRRGLREFFGMDSNLDEIIHSTGVNEGLYPEFEERIIEDRGENVLMQDKEGVVVLKGKFMSSIPHPVEHTLKDRESWEIHYKPRLDPTDSGRFPADWAERVANWQNLGRNEVLALPGGSLYGCIRNWMGLENLSYLVHDDPSFFEEMVATVADCTIGVLQTMLETDVKFDACKMWEDMCYNAGPLLSPAHFKQFLVPHYRRITDLLHSHDVDIIWVDCDGKIDQLLPLWLEAGVNCMFPIEIGTWKADPVRFRQEYGSDLLMMGGFDKRILAGPLSDIRQEVIRLAPLVEEGGFIGFCDHRVPPDVPLENYLYFLECIREMWGKNINLEPMLFSLVDIRGAS